METKELIAAPFQPMHRDGSLDLKSVEGLAAGLRENGVTGAFICGTTGEGLSLTISERRQVAEQWRNVIPNDFKLMVQVGHNTVSDARALAAHAQEIGADAIGCLPPTFYRPRGVTDLIDFCERVAGAAPNLPFYYYHIPSMTGVNLSMTELLTRGAERIPTLAGVKFTYEDLMDFIRCLKVAGGRFRMLFGRDECLLAALSLGASGFIGSTFNWMAPVFREILDQFDSGDLDRARRAQSKASEAVSIFVQYGGIPAGKAIMKWVGFDCGPVRSPQIELSESEKAQLRADLEAIDFFEFASRYHQFYH